MYLFTYTIYHRSYTLCTASWMDVRVIAREMRDVGANVIVGKIPLFIHTGVTEGTCGGQQWCIQGLGGRPEVKRTVGRGRRRWVDDFKTYLQ